MKTILSILMADLAGYTSLTEVHGGSTAANIVHKFFEIAKSSLIDPCKIQETVGDEIMIISKESDSLLATALSMSSQTLKKPDFPGLHIGLHRGNCFMSNGKLFGTTINLTSRLTDYSERNQILCTLPFKQNIIKTEDQKFLSLGDIRFKNLSVPYEVFEVIKPYSEIEKQAIDPVCKMHFSVKKDTLRMPFQNREYYFCSRKCLRIFQHSPINFTNNGK